MFLFISSFNQISQNPNDHRMIFNRLNDQLEAYIKKNPQAAGSKLVVVQELVTYKVKCVLCKKKMNANRQQKKETHCKNWNIQIFTRHFDKHLKPKREQNA